MRPLTTAVMALTLIASLAVGWAVAKNEGGDMAQKIDIYEVYNDLPIIFWQVEKQDYAAVDALLQAGADIETRGFFGMTPIVWAASGGSWGMVKLLIARGADLTVYAGNGMTVADLALNSRVLLDSPNGRHLQDVRAILAEHGLYDDIPPPQNCVTRWRQAH